ncbi:MAG: hypothetical protein EZS28_017081 [Streblomastix strix]|uniref:Uncharacterized protein n=1 Tax=Streblomastix strix TaxID=222440 RepID=A0A5J4VXZ0_9EUKA|nr:MAG: hypothetical protein EZS28_017081 [Streblomastix strix]
MRLCKQLRCQRLRLKFVAKSKGDFDLNLNQTRQFHSKMKENIIIPSKRLNLNHGCQRSCGTYITMRQIEEAIGQQTNVPYLIPVRFKLSIPLDDLLKFSAFTDYLNGMFGDLTIKFKINPNAFEFAQINPTHGCTADFITSIRTEQLTQSGLKNLVCDIAPVTVSIKNYVVTEVTANMAGYKATDACLARVRDFFSTRAFVVPAQRVEIWLFQISAKHTEIRTSQIFLYVIFLTLCYYSSKIQDALLALRIHVIKICNQQLVEETSLICS